MKKILVPTDFSENAQQALDVAVQIAKKIDAEIVLLHVNEQIGAALPVSEYYYTYDRSIEEKYLNMVHENLEKMLGDVAARLNAHNIRTAVIGGPFSTIVEDVVQTEGVDLIIMGTKGASGLKEFFVGSNTEKVVRTAKCPVLTVHDNKTFEFKNIVVPTTLEADQKKLFESLREWEAIFGGKYHLLYINNPGAYRGDKDIEAREKELVESTGLKNVEIYKTETFTLNEEQVIFDFAKEQHADLIVMGTHQRRGLAHVLLGSLTEDTINHAAIPVLAIPLK
ncbi:MAG: universal stress protein [Haliscomenobacter sp.]|nr:universal stress protein [Haliscomenobacter sp.]MBK9490008.1 universal stress protein [Haliscomenobacter sp.]